MDPARVVISAEEIIKLLSMKPHPEGGFFVESYRACEMLAAASLPERYGQARSVSTCIYYLLTAGAFSALHRVASDETFHFYLGDAVEMLQLAPDGGSRTVRIGPRLAEGERPQVIVPHRWWQGCRLAEGGAFALLGCTVAPGFDFADFELGRRLQLQTEYPQCKEMIAALTRL